MNVRQGPACALPTLARGLPRARDAVVHHVGDTEAKVLGALRKVRKHLDTDLSAKLMVVAHAQGVDFLQSAA